ncbi:uncharacterized protein UBRO_05619-A [Ustilago bromivora]|uniref:Protein YAE1 n=1 Tax=Ustilago bromivora TaxID=307758 RepID=A0A1K0G9B7_9BASI|nr:uncharacterized protein UBRO_05619-A [Ustilago bromivora]
MEQEAAPSSFRTLQNEQTDWTCAVSTPATCTATGTPSRQSLPRRLSLLQNDTSSSSSSSARTDDGRRTSFTGPKPLSLGSQSVTTPTTASASASGFDTPRRGKHTSLSYISSPSTSSASGRTRTGSISRTARGSRRRPSQASDTAADDWLMSEDDTSFSLPAAARAMGERDSAKVEAQLHDTGYREGITAGKLSTLQQGFDTGFNEVGALLGRQLGQLRGQVAALLFLTSTPIPDPTSTSTFAGNTCRARCVAMPPSAGSVLPLLKHPQLEQARRELEELAKELDGVTLGKIAEPDYEALEHEREHAAQDGGGGGGEGVKRQTEEERRERVAVLQRLEERVHQVRPMNGKSKHKRTSGSASLDSTATTDPTNSLSSATLSSATLSSATLSSATLSSATLLRLIAEKERRLFELREELSTTETQLHRLRSTWQRSATREVALAQSTCILAASNGSHKRDGSDSVADAWGTLKSGLNNFLDSIANPPPASAPAPVEKDCNLLRPTRLGVLEEEASDLGSAAVSPRSPRSPSGVGVDEGNKLLGFSVDSNGLAHLGGQGEERGPERPPKIEQMPTSGKWSSHRTSVLGSLSNLQSKLTDTTTTKESNDGGGSGGGGWLARRFREAQQNASDLLKEAERKLGDAMNLDDLLGVTPSPAPSANLQGRSTSPHITLEEASFDSNPTRSPWYAAAGGLPRRTADRSPSLNPADGQGRLSISTTFSSGSGRRSLDVGGRKGANSPNLSHSPPVGGAPGSAGVFGLFMGKNSCSSDLAGKPSSGDWGWAANDDDQEAWEQDQSKTNKNRESLVSITLEDTPKPEE